MLTVQRGANGWPRIDAAAYRTLATLLPIKARLARTDALIDQIVYQLYGLVEAKMTVVERR